MSTIIETALEAVGRPVPDRYQAVAQRVQNALENRERNMFDDIVEAGVELGATRDQVHLILVNAGMTTPLEVVDAHGDPGDEHAEVMAAIGAINDRIDRLVGKAQHALTWARGQGYRPGRR
jgi:hypothetical protein